MNGTNQLSTDTESRKPAQTLILTSCKKGLQPGSKLGSAHIWFQKMLEDNLNIFFKILVIGPAKCGKTTIIKQYTDGIFEKDYNTTFGMHNYIKNVGKKGKTVKMTIWDTPNYAKFQAQIECNYETSDAIV